MLHVDNRIDDHISRTENDLEKLSMLINEFATDFQAQIDGLQTETQKIQDSGQSGKQDTRRCSDNNRQTTKKRKMKSVIVIILSIVLIWHIGIPLRASEIEPDEITVLAVGDITIGSSLTPIIERQGAGVFF